MQLLKDNFWPTVIILMASFVVIFAFSPLENTEWAEGFRSAQVSEEGGVGEAEDEPFGEAGRLTGFAALLPMIKVALFMGIGVLFTAVGRSIGRMATRLSAG